MTTVEIAWNVGQRAALAKFNDFLKSDRSVFILKGSAGTGKSTLIASIISSLGEQHRSFAALAPTGRAARVLQERAGCEARTIHSAIYLLDEVVAIEPLPGAAEEDVRLTFRLKQDNLGVHVFVIDEASMVGDKGSNQEQLQFGSGRVLKDLIEFARVRTGSRGKILFVGDPAQLPPVGSSISPAMDRKYLKENFALESEEFELTEVMRQSSGSAILERATRLREAIQRAQFNTIDLAPSGDEIVALSASEAVAQTVAARVAGRKSVLVTFTNQRAREMNRAIRARLWKDAPPSVRVGDVLLVNRNSSKHSLSNGDLMLVKGIQPPVLRQVKLHRVELPVRLEFQEVALRSESTRKGAVEVSCLLLTNLLDSPEASLTAIESRALFVDFKTRHPMLKPKSAEFGMELMADPYFNAVQVKYGYALTCHKAQGGEWESAIVDFSDRRAGPNQDYFRWVYTAITRAKNRLGTIHAPSFGPMSSMKWDVLERASAVSQQDVPFAEPTALPMSESLQQVDRAPASRSAIATSCDENPRFEELEQRLGAALAGSGIEFVGREAQQYKLLVHFEEGKHNFSLDFWYSTKKGFTWSKTRETFGPGSSKGGLEKVMTLWNRPNGQ